MISKYDVWVGKTIQFEEKAEDLECYPEKNMRAKVLSVKLSNPSPDPHNVVYAVKVDYTDFDDFNRQFETANYYDKNQKPTLNARDAGYYTPVETLYLSDEVYGLWNEIFKIVGDKANKLVETYNAEAPNMSYIEWLESKA